MPIRDAGARSMAAMWGRPYQIIALVEFVSRTIAKPSAIGNTRPITKDVANTTRPEKMAGKVPVCACMRQEKAKKSAHVSTIGAMCMTSATLAG